MLKLVSFAACILVIGAHPYYRDLIPNGYNVPNPCGGGIWEAVGHYDALHHTIQKNQFGQVSYVKVSKRKETNTSKATRSEEKS